MSVKLFEHIHFIHFIHHIQQHIQIQDIAYKSHVLNLLKVNSRDPSRNINVTLFVFDLIQIISGCLVIQMKFFRLLPNSLVVY